MAANGSGGYVLGVDLGVSSVGWARTRVGQEGAFDVLQLGAHVFEAGVGEGGNETTQAAVRRQKRAIRRGLWRKRRRKRKLLRALQRHGLLPPDVNLTTSENIDAFLKDFDVGLKPRWCANGEPHENLLHRLRAAAADGPIETHEVGRALYHLAQRRGFLSNRKAERGDEDEGKVKAAIGELEERIANSGLPTLGAFLASLDPHEERLLSRWTSRSMYEREFDAIWTMQAPHHPSMTDDAKEEIRSAIFFQRPLRSQRELIGRCSVFPNCRRAPKAHRLAQRFRVLQQVNNLRVEHPGQEPRPLSAEERGKLVGQLMKTQTLNIATAKAKKSLGLPREAIFNVEADDEAKLRGSSTDARLHAALDDAYDSLSEAEKDALVDDLRSIEDDEALRRRLRDHWGLTPEQVTGTLKVRLEPGYFGFSLRALRALVPVMEDGLTTSEARQKEFGDSGELSGRIEDLLPPVHSVFPDLRNPTVIRALTEVRRVVNAIVREHGKPDAIRIELARELKRSPKQKEKDAKQNRAREREREAIRERIRTEFPSYEPSRTDIEKVLLADECNWICPFSGRSFGMHELLGPTPQLDIEHIWPLSRSLDNSFLNKTLCFHDENRKHKGNRTPYEAYSGDPERFEAMLERVRRFKRDYRASNIKLERFKAEEIPEGFSTRHLNDTRYISRLATDYLGILYGGEIDLAGKRRIHATSGGATAWLRHAWGLDALLGGHGKTRADHRHHAVDAIVVALTTPSHVKQLSDAAGRAEARDADRPFDDVESPLRQSREELAAMVEKVLVSRRQSRKLRGGMHADSLYSAPIAPSGERRIRKDLKALKPTDLDKIIDRRSAAAIEAKLAELGQTDPSKAFTDPANLPEIRARDGRTFRLRHVRVRVKESVRTIGVGPRERHVAPTQGSNHHSIIFAVLDKAGNEKKWDDEPVTRLECYQRMSQHPGQEIVQRELGPGRHFKFSIASGDFLELDAENDLREIYRVANVSKGEFELRLHADARTAKELRTPGGGRIRANAEKLRRLRARKVSVTPLGELRRAGG